MEPTIPLKNTAHIMNPGSQQAAQQFHRGHLTYNCPQGQTSGMLMNIILISHEYIILVHWVTTPVIF